MGRRRLRIGKSPRGGYDGRKDKLMASYSMILKSKKEFRVNMKYRCTVGKYTQDDDLQAFTFFADEGFEIRIPYKNVQAFLETDFLEIRTTTDFVSII